MLQKRATYAAFEETILDLYDRNVLTLNLLNDVADQYRQVEIDNAGSRYLRTYDGKDLQQVCIGLIDPTFPLIASGSRADDEEYWEQELNKWEAVVRHHWRWQAYCNPFPLNVEQGRNAGL